MVSSLLHSYFLQVLGGAIIASIWQSLILWLIFRIIVQSAVTLKPVVKHNLGVIMVFAGFGWFAITFLYRFFSGVQNYPDGFYPSVQKLSAESLLSIPPNISASLSLGYLVLLGLLMVRLFLSIKNTLKLYRMELLPVNPAILSFTLKSAALLKIRRKISVWISNTVSNPSTIGFIKPVILLPAICITHLSPEQMEAIIIHELSHIKRNDFIVNILLLIIETILFFNPFVYLFMKNIRREREHCCDDLVLKYNYEPIHYAKALLTISRFELGRQQLAMNAVSGKYQLLQRIRRITSGEIEKQSNFSPRILAYAFIVSLFLFVFAFVPQNNERNIANSPRPAFVSPEKNTLAKSPEKKVTETFAKNVWVSNQNKTNFPGRKNIPDKKKDQQTAGINISPDKINSPAIENSQNVQLTLQEAQKATEQINWQQLGNNLQTVVESTFAKNIGNGNFSKSLEKTLEGIDLKKYQQQYRSEVDKFKNLSTFLKSQKAFVRGFNDSLAGFRNIKPEDYLKMIQQKNLSEENLKQLILNNEKASNEIQKRFRKFLRVADI